MLSSAVLQFDLPVLGHVKLVTALFFDLGVYLIVVGLVLDVLRSLGARVDEEMVGAAMTTYLVPLVLIGGLTSAGVYLLLERNLTRMLLGLLLIGNAVNLLILTVGGPSGNPPIRGRTSDGATTTADPLAQGMILTAIVITMGIAAFVLALTYRSYRLSTGRGGRQRPRGHPRLAAVGPAAATLDEDAPAPGRQPRHRRTRRARRAARPRGVAK